MHVPEDGKKNKYFKQNKKEYFYKTANIFLMEKVCRFCF